MPTVGTIFDLPLLQNLQLQHEVRAVQQAIAEASATLRNWLTFAALLLRRQQQLQLGQPECSNRIIEPFEAVKMSVMK